MDISITVVAIWGLQPRRPGEPGKAGKVHGTGAHVVGRCDLPGKCIDVTSDCQADWADRG